MAKNRPYAKKIPIFYRKQTFDIMLFTHITAMQQFQMPVIDAIENFRQTYGISIDDLSDECARVTYSNMKNAFLWKNLKENEF